MFAVLISIKLNAQTIPVTAGDVPRILSYQGKLTSSNGDAMNGTHKITATLYSDHIGKNSIWTGSYDADVKEGVFSILLGSTRTKLPDNTAMNQPLWVGIKVDDGTEMQPLAQLAATPYALNVADRSITFDKLAPEVVLGMIGIGHKMTPQAVLSGAGNQANTNDVVAGGTNNDARGPTAPGGDNNAITGGELNKVINADGNPPDHVFIGGGKNNGLADEVSFGVVGGGEGNLIEENDDNEIGAAHSIIGGGQQNKISGASLSAICGGYKNIILASAGVDPNSSFIGGGYQNQVNGWNNTIGGGINNQTFANSSVIAGGNGNAANSNGSFIGAGSSNKTFGWNSCIPGGEDLQADVYTSTVIGHHSRHNGTAIWPPVDLDRIFMIGNGADSNHRTNAFEVSTNGHSIVYDQKYVSKPDPQPSIFGATYQDNIIYAWADVDPPAGVNNTMVNVPAIIHCSFGVVSVKFTWPNKYDVVLATSEPINNTATSLSCGSVTVTSIAAGTTDPGCQSVSVTRLSGNTFTIWTHKWGGLEVGCTVSQDPFYFKVCGEPPSR